MIVKSPQDYGFSPDRLARIDQMCGEYVESGKLAGLVTLVARKGEVVHFEAHGWQNKESGTPMQRDTVFRIYSMTKPITSVALMMLYEAGHFHLSDPVAKYIPAFRDVKVYGENGTLEACHTPMTVQDLLRHTAGLSYGGFGDDAHPVDKLYSEADLFNKGQTNAEMVAKLAQIPLMFQPGTRWHYSMATDVVGYLVELFSGMSLGDFFAERIFKPLGMVDTAFEVDADKSDRFATLYGTLPDGETGVLDHPQQSHYLSPVHLQSGGGGLVGTAADYFRFAQCLANGGTLDGVRLLGRKTVELMTSNSIHPDLMPVEYNGVVETVRDGVGFGLLGSVFLDMGLFGVVGNAGTFGWGGYADTYFWVDPVDDIVGIVMTQYLPSMTYPVRADYRVAVYQALE